MYTTTTFKFTITSSSTPYHDSSFAFSIFFFFFFLNREKLQKLCLAPSCLPSTSKKLKRVFPFSFSFFFFFFPEEEKKKKQTTLCSPHLLKPQKDLGFTEQQWDGIGNSLPKRAVSSLHTMTPVLHQVSDPGKASAPPPPPPPILCKQMQYKMREDMEIGGVLWRKWKCQNGEKII